jgi:hypothetical protein
MDIFKILIFSIICFLGTFSEMNSQITLIPDSGFEQALIDLGIDSDGIINGQVLTIDIEGVIILDVNHSNIQDLTGIEDFAALEILDVSGNELIALNVSSNIELKELYCNSQQGAFSMYFTELDLSQNINLEVLYCENLAYLENLNLKNGNNQILTVELSCEFEGNPCELSELYCVQVDDESAANNNEPPYNTWFIQANFIYSEDCSLSIPALLEDRFIIYPNPTTNLLTIQNQNNLKIDSVSLYDTLGRKVMESNEATESMDVSNLTAGVYFIHITTDRGIVTKKIIKK